MMTLPSSSTAGSMDFGCAVAQIRAAHRIAAATHITPDSDAIGSLLGLGHLLETIGKEIVLLCDDPVPRLLRFLPGSTKVVDTLPSDFTPDMFIGLDASDPERLGKVSQPHLASGIPTLNVDHHVTNLLFCDVNLVEPGWSATAEGIVALGDRLAAQLTLDAATCLLAGIVGDTRNFATSSTTPASLIAAAKLVNVGADIAFISEMLWNRRALATLRLWGLGLSRLRFEDGILWTVVSMEDRRVLGLHETNATGLSNILLSADEAVISAVFTEQPDSTIDASFRARPGYDVALVALELGGGGHALAAGAKLTGPLEEAAQNAVRLLKAQAARANVGSR